MSHFRGNAMGGLSFLGMCRAPGACAIAAIHQVVNCPFDLNNPFEEGTSIIAQGKTRAGQPANQRPTLLGGGWQLPWITRTRSLWIFCVECQSWKC